MLYKDECFTELNALQRLLGLPDYSEVDMLDMQFISVIDPGLVGSTNSRGSRVEGSHTRGTSWEGYHASRRCSRDTHPESYTIKYSSTVDVGLM